MASSAGSKETFPGDLIHSFFKQLQVHSFEIQGPDFALWQTCLPWDQEISQGMISTAQAASCLIPLLKVSIPHPVMLLLHLVCLIPEGFSHCFPGQLYFFPRRYLGGWNPTSGWELGSVTFPAAEAGTASAAVQQLLDSLHWSGGP